MKTLAVVLCLALAAPVLAVDVHDTRLLSEPAVSANRIAFAYANDLWTARHDGAGVQRLTSHPGVETAPRFSPDGALVAFTGRYEGNTDVYVVAAGGGEPKRLTWHPGADIVLGFTPDGKAVLFASQREVHTTRLQQLFTVPVEGGAVSKLPVPSASKASFSPDGRTIAYVPLREPFQGWKQYRGGMTSRILLLDLASLEVEQVPQPESRSNDTDPMWAGDALYFRSDRNGELNLFRFDRASKQVAQVTAFTDFPVLNASAGSGRIAFEQAGWLYLLDPATNRPSRLKIGVATDLAEPRTRFAKGAKYVRSASLSPTGARAAFELRGEIVTVPAEKGDDRNLTQSVAAHDRSPVWSPDGKSIAWFSDESGEYQLHIAPQEGRGATKKIKVAGAGFYANPKWSPDGKWISYVDNSHSIWVVDPASGSSTKVSSNLVYRPGPILDHAWSPDSKWLAHTLTGATQMQSIHLWSVAEKKLYPLTDGLSDAREPVFDPNGKYLYFLASTNAGPTADWFSQSSLDMRQTNAIYLAVLPKGVASPLAKESDEEPGAAAASSDAAKTEGKDAKKDDAKKDDAKKDDAKKPVVIDFTRLGQRIQALPIPTAFYSDLEIASTGQLLYLKRDNGTAFPSDDPGTLMRFDLTKRKDAALLEGVNDYALSGDGKRVLVQMKDSWAIADMGDKLDVSKYRLGIDRVEVRVDPRAEWKQMYDESYRLHRDWFYDPNYHGADLSALRTKYAQFLPHLASRNDLNRVMQWFGSELVVGHFYLGGGDTLTEVESIPGGLLGADYEVANGRYRFKKVYGGLNWNPELRAPLTEPGIDVVEGEYLLAVDGKELRYPDNLYARFERTSGRFTEITVGPNSDGKGSRTVNVVPIANEASLRIRDWVERNIRYVTEKSKGRIAYVWVPNTGDSGHESFKRYFFPQANREAIIVDERFNGGGLVADYYIDILRRPLISFWATRYGADLKTPLASIQGPKAMLIDENAGSGGDLLPWMFRKFEMGPLIGRRTWGGLVGILGYPDLMDGGSLTSPNLAFWSEDEGFGIENVGVPPDIEVEITPKDFAAGRDTQLDKAIEVLLQQLEANPVVLPKRPPYPVRTGR